MGRPKLEINWTEFDNLCADQCTLEEIAAYFGINRDTLMARVKEKYNTTFSEVFRQKRSVGFASLRSKQFELAMSGNPTMLIWLGKQYLNQGEKMSVEHKGSTIVEMVKKALDKNNEDESE